MSASTSVMPRPSPGHGDTSRTCDPGSLPGREIAERRGRGPHGQLQLAGIVAFLGHEPPELGHQGQRPSTGRGRARSTRRRGAPLAPVRLASRHRCGWEGRRAGSASGGSACPENATCSPWWSTGSSRHSLRHTAIASSRRRPRPAISTPTASHSWRSQPAPTPTSARPPDTMSSVWIERAATNGLRKARMYTFVPRRMDVRAGAEVGEVHEGVEPGPARGDASRDARCPARPRRRPGRPGARGATPTRSPDGRPPPRPQSSARRHRGDAGGAGRTSSTCASSFTHGAADALGRCAPAR